VENVIFVELFFHYVNFSYLACYYVYLYKAWRIIENNRMRSIVKISIDCVGYSVPEGLTLG